MFALSGYTGNGYQILYVKWNLLITISKDVESKIPNVTTSTKKENHKESPALVL